MAGDPEHDQRWRSLSDQATCHICMAYFKEPVSVQCGHTFCTTCITNCWKGVKGPYPCPQCREKAPTNTLRPNHQLASIVEILNRGTPVVPPAAAPPNREGHVMCTEHDEKLKLFCEEDQIPICVICRESQGHQDHKVRPVREAAQEYQDKFQSYLDDVKWELEHVLGLQQKEEVKLTDLEVNVEIQRDRLTRVFSQLQEFLEKERCRHLGNLEEEEKSTRQRIRDKVTKLDDRQTMVRDQITEIETKLQLPDVELLKNVKSITSRFEKLKCHGPDSANFKDKVTEALKDEDAMEEGEENEEAEEVEVQLDVEKKDLVLKIMESLEWRWACSYSSEVILDPDTAHWELVLSEDGKSVSRGEIAQNLPDIPERFNPVISVLGGVRLSSGKHYWEVEVGDKTRWSLGVCDESVSRKGTIKRSPERGYWAVWFRDGKYIALSAPRTLLTPSVFPRIIGLFLDYEAGRFSVYNVTGRSLLFTFSGAFSPRVLRPYFNPGLNNGGKNGDALRVLPATGPE